MTIKHAHPVTIIMTKQCGGTLVRFDSVLFRLDDNEHVVP